MTQQDSAVCWWPQIRLGWWSKCSESKQPSILGSCSSKAKGCQLHPPLLQRMLLCPKILPKAVGIHRVGSAWILAMHLLNKQNKSLQTRRWLHPGARATPGKRRGWRGGRWGATKRKRPQSCSGDVPGLCRHVWYKPTLCSNII